MVHYIITIIVIAVGQPKNSAIGFVEKNDICVSVEF